MNSANWDLSKVTRSLFVRSKLYNEVTISRTYAVVRG
jgi:hypothetical protein